MTDVRPDSRFVERKCDHGISLSMPCPTCKAEAHRNGWAVDGRMTSPSVEEMKKSVEFLKCEIERYENLKKTDDAWGFLHRQRAAFVERGHYLYFAAKAALKHIDDDEAGTSRALLEEAINEVAGDRGDFKEAWTNPPPAPPSDYAPNEQHKNMHIYNPSIAQQNYWREKVNRMMYVTRPELKRD